MRGEGTSIDTRSLAMLMLVSFGVGAGVGSFLPGPSASPDSSAVGLDSPMPTPPAGSPLPQVDDVVGSAANVESAGDELPFPDMATAAEYRAWARRDPVTFLAAIPEFLARGDLSLMTADATGGGTGATAIRLAAEMEPWLALDVADAIGGEFGTTVMAAALEALAAFDPESALARVENMRTSDRRRRSVAAIAAGFARHDLDAAIDWAVSLAERNKAFAIPPIVVALARVDLVRAIDINEQTFGHFGASRDSSWLIAGLESGRQDPSDAANRLAGTQSTRLLAETMAWWIHRDPYAAVRWVLEQETVSATAIERMAGTLAQKDGQAALALAGQFPPAVRARWTETVAGTIANYDPNTAFAVLTAFEAEPFYDETRSNVARAITLSVGPEAAAGLVGSTPGMVTALAIVDNWPDFPRAAAWALAISDSRVREQAVISVVESWAKSDASVARAWVAGIGDDALRSEMAAIVQCFEDARCP